jgi:hypothetical protein
LFVITREKIGRVFMINPPMGDICGNHLQRR